MKDLIMKKRRWMRLVSQFVQQPFAIIFISLRGTSCESIGEQIALRPRSYVLHICSRVTSFAMIYASRALGTNLYLFIHRNNEGRPRSLHAHPLSPSLSSSRGNPLVVVIQGFGFRCTSPARTVYHLPGFIASPEGDSE